MLADAARVFNCAAGILHRVAATEANEDAPEDKRELLDVEREKDGQSEPKDALEEEHKSLDAKAQTNERSAPESLKDGSKPRGLEPEQDVCSSHMEPFEEEAKLLVKLEKDASMACKEPFEDDSTSLGAEPGNEDCHIGNELLEDDDKLLVVESVKDDSLTRTGQIEDAYEPSITESDKDGCVSPSEIPPSPPYQADIAKCATAQDVTAPTWDTESIPPPPPYDPPAGNPANPEAAVPPERMEELPRGAEISVTVSGGQMTSPERILASTETAVHSTACDASPSSITEMSENVAQTITRPGSMSVISENTVQTTTSPGNMSVISDSAEVLDQVRLSDVTSMDLSSPTEAINRGNRRSSGASGSRPASSLVSKRVDAYETFLATTEAEINTPIKLPMPESPVLSSTHASEAAAISPAKGNLITKLQANLSEMEEACEKNSHAMVSTESQDQLSMASTGDLSSRFEDEDVLDSCTDCYVREPENTAKLRIQGSDSREISSPVDTESSSQPKASTQFEDTDAPLGVESLQELIPEVIPGVGRKRLMSPPQLFVGVIPDRDPQLFPEHPLDDMPEITLDDDDTIIRVESMEKLPSFSLSRQGSLASLQTESYSSPDSPVHISPGHIGLLSRHRESWRASDHDLFSEDPMIECKNIQENTISNAKSRISGNELGSPIDSTRIESSLVEDYDSAKMIVGVRRAESRRNSSSLSDEDEADALTPFPKPADRSSWQRRSEELDFVQSQQPIANDVKSKAGLPEHVANRQTSVDVSTMSSSPLMDRERSTGRDRSLMARFSPSRMSAKVFLAPVTGQPLPSSMVGRSISASDDRYEDWPEYRPSLGDAAAGGRRHRSDMSVGANARRRDMLPFELLHGHTLNDTSPDVERDIPVRFRSTRRRWMRIFGRSAASREATDARGAVKNILRIGRRPLITDETFIAGDNGTDSAYRPPVERSNRRSVSVACDFKFDIELGQETVFSLLNRICPECGFNVTVRRPTYKMKVEVPCEVGRVPLLVSIQLSRSSHGKGTFVSMGRSKEDQSGGPLTDIEAAGVLLRKRLGSHVEFIEDSFAELYMQDCSTSRDPRNGSTLTSGRAE